MPLGWFRSYLATSPATERRATGPVTRVGSISQPPVILLHPGEDRWTAPELSERFLARLGGPTRAARLRGCGHFPVEEPGFQQLLDEVAAELSTIPGNS